MVCNSVVVLRVAHASAGVWQRLACIEERISSRELLDLVCCFPLQQLGRLTLCLWTFLCLPPPGSYYFRSYPSSDDDSDSSSAVDLDDHYYHSHSD